MRHVALSWVLAALLSGCSSQWKVTDVTEDEPVAPSGGAVRPTKVAGVPVRVPEKLRVRVFRLKADKDAYEQVFTTAAVLPHPWRKLAVNFDGGFFSDAKVNLKLTPEGYLDLASMETQLKFDEALDAIADQLGAVGGAANELVAKQRAAREAERAAERAAIAEAEAKQKAAAEEERKRLAELETSRQSKETALAAALNSLQAVEAAQRELARMGDDVEVEVRAQAEAKVLRLRFEANVAHRRAGLPQPYPGTFFGAE